MSKGKRNFIIVIAILVILIVSFYSFLKGSYNSFVSMDESVKASWAQVENQLQRRYDLIPNLVETVKGFAAQEKEVFIGVTEARSKVGTAASIPQKIEANKELTGALSRLMVVMERYPEIKSNQNFLRLQDELAGTENRIAVERRRYNETVKDYNVKIRIFPSNILAGLFGFEKATFFEIPEAAKIVPKVSFK
ncbi:MAG: LemA family protein [Syntrophales bacterium]|jgi:LemA protein|nr:LemA family protein [Syntrophales bacterium]MDY0043634.1 LemA family protein [Syntrophales bacterium]